MFITLDSLSISIFFLNFTEVLTENKSHDMAYTEYIYD